MARQVVKLRTSSKCAICKAGEDVRDRVDPVLARQGEPDPQTGQPLTWTYILKAVLPHLLGKPISKTSVRPHLGLAGGVSPHTQLVDDEEEAEKIEEEIAAPAETNALLDDIAASARRRARPQPPRRRRLAAGGDGRDAHAHRLGVSGNLKRTLESTNPCESMLEIVRRTQRNVKRWSSGEMALRWTAAGMLEAERQFRRIIGYRDLATLIVAIERDHDRRRHADAAPTPTKEAAIVLTA
jgi:hypothetical protein